MIHSLKELSLFWTFGAQLFEGQSAWSQSGKIPDWGRYSGC